MFKKLFRSLEVLLLCQAGSAWSQTGLGTERHFRELFLTAGYSTAFGAALGAAAIGLTENPGDKVRYVAVGASMGFIVGSMIGTYVIFTPMLSYPGGATYGSSLQKMSPDSPWSLEPSWDLSNKQLSGLRLRWLAASF